MIKTHLGILNVCVVRFSEAPAGMNAGTRASRKRPRKETPSKAVTIEPLVEDSDDALDAEAFVEDDDEDEVSSCPTANSSVLADCVVL